MEKRLRLGVFPNLPKEKVRALLPKLVEFCRAEEIPVVFPREIAESFGVPGYDQEDPGSLAETGDVADGHGVREPLILIIGEKRLQIGVEGGHRCLTVPDGLFCQRA